LLPEYRFTDNDETPRFPCCSAKTHHGLLHSVYEKQVRGTENRNECISDNFAASPTNKFR
jgi:hypothetical protein